MPVSCVGRKKAELDTPVLLVDLDRMEANIATIAGACRAAGISWRPHFKGIKVPAISLRAIAAGAIGITCAKLGEAEIARGLLPSDRAAEAVLGALKPS